jgi:anhydro-N-acetylmuramic acid kinase
MLLNYLCEQINLPYDHNGNIAAQADVNEVLLNTLNQWSYYTKNPPKSLGKEQVFEDLLPIIQIFEDTIPNKIATITQHIADQIAQSIQQINIKNNVLITGGGAMNSHLLKIITQKTQAQIQTHSPQMIEFKEAIVFGFLGYLRLLNRPNTLQSVTGATQNSVGGAVYHPPFFYETNGVLL